MNMMTIMFVYILRETDWKYSLLNTLMVTAYTPGILLSPLFHKIDYRKLYFLSRTLSIITTTAGFICLAFKMVNPITFAVVVIVANWFNLLIGQTMNVVNNNLGTNLAEYQMWISGERMGGFSGIFGWFTGPINTFMGFIMPIILMGLGYKGNQAVLYIDDVRVSVLMAGCGLKFAGDVASMIPQIWFKFSKKQHDQINLDLAWRMQAAQDLEPVNAAANRGEDAEAVLQEVIAMRANRNAAEIKLKFSEVEGDNF
jgi:Na+/melibiose symporter-like transporter